MQPPRRQPRGRSSASSARAHLTLLHPSPAAMLEGPRAAVRRIDAPLDAASPAAAIAPPVAFRPPPLRPAGGELPRPPPPMSELEVAIDALRVAAQSDSVAAKGDAILAAMAHLTCSLADLFDRDVARAFVEKLARNV